MEIEIINDWLVAETEITKSTNDDALFFELPKDGNKKFVFCAKKQTSGRGRLGRKWDDGEGNLMFSAIVKCSNNDAGRLALVSGISVLKTIKEYDASANLSLKWPNDVLLNDKKVCGILIERKDDANMVVGIGVNIKNAPVLENKHYQATSLQDCKIAATRKDFLRRFLKIFNEWLEKIEKKEFNFIKETWMNNAKNINQPVEIENIKGKTAGKLIGVDEECAIIVEKDNKQIKIYTGDVSYL